MEQALRLRREIAMNDEGRAALLEMLQQSSPPESQVSRVLRFAGQIATLAGIVLEVKQLRRAIKSKEEVLSLSAGKLLASFCFYQIV